MMWPFSRRSISEDDLVDLQGKVVIITGGNSGIGYSTTQFLARRGAKESQGSQSKLAACNNAKLVITGLEREGLGGGSLHWLKLDLLDSHGVKSAAEEFLNRETRLDILINNAGIGVGTYSLTEDGLLDVMTINYLGHFIFTEILLPLLIQTSKGKDSDVRIVNVSSDAHSEAKPTSFIGKENFNKEYGTSLGSRKITYGLSKLANILHIKHLQRRLDLKNARIICLAVHPGWAMTPMVSRIMIEEFGSIFGHFWNVVLSMFFLSARQGAMNSAYAAASPEVMASSYNFRGAYLNPVGVVFDSSAQSKNENLMDELYDTTIAILKELDIEA